MPENLFELERSTLTRLGEVVAARAAAETEIATAFQTATEKAERDVNRARKANAAARQTELAAIDAAYATATAEIAKRFDGELGAAERSRETKSAQVAERFRIAEKKAKAEYQDQLWTVDSVLEGGEKQARDQQEVLNRKASAGLAQVEAFWAETDPLLARVKLKRDAVAFTGELPKPDDNDPISRVQKAADSAETAIDELRKLPLPPLANPAGLIACVIGGAIIGAMCSFPFLPPAEAIGITITSGSLIGVGAYLIIKMLAKSQTIAAGKVVAERLALATRACRLLTEYAASEFFAQHKKLIDRHARKRRETELYYRPLFDAQQRQFDGETAKIQAEFDGVGKPLREGRQTASQAAESDYRARRTAVESRLNGELEAAEKTYSAQTAAAVAARDAAFSRLLTDWQAKTSAVGQIYTRIRDEGARLFPSWEYITDDYPLPTQIPGGIRFGDRLTDIRGLPNALSNDQRLIPPTTLIGSTPTFIPFPERSALVLKARDERRGLAVSILQALMLRFLTGLPPGKVRFTVIDPVGLGENFGSFMHLADYDEKLITSQIWTEANQIERQLTNLTDHHRHRDPEVPPEPV